MRLRPAALLCAALTFGAGSLVGDCTPGVAPCDRAVAGECSSPND